MKSVIIYSSPKGKCRKVAEEVGKQLTMPVYDVNNPVILTDTDFLVLISGGPYSGENDGALEGFVKKQKENFVKVVAVVTLDSSWKNTSVAEIMNVRSNQKRLHRILEEKKVDILDEHFCQTRYLFFYPTHPNKRDISKTKEWLEDVMKLAQRVV